ncbi:PREDICTED: CD63 antigen, partial [Condylura cristata]|uniref:CD63 antigen n=1 Tax=Condylura cristata TaxID=143302 RepID=UPI000643C494
LGRRPRSAPHPPGPSCRVTQALVIAACAVALITVGVAAQLFLNQTVNQGATPGSLVPVVIIAVGAFLFLVAFVGCCGACKENYCLMMTFAIFLSLIMLVEVATAIAGYMFRNKVMSEFNENFRKQMQDYPRNNRTALVLDKVQQEFQCCGAVNYTDWEHIPAMGKERVPDSCCRNVTQGCGDKFKVEDIYREGCVEKVGVWLRKNVLVVAGVALGIAAVEALGVVLACCLVRSIRSGYEVM